MCERNENMELLLENLIRMQGKLNEKVDCLSGRLNQVECTLAQAPPCDHTTRHQTTMLCRS